MEVKLCFSEIFGLSLKNDIMGFFKEVQRISGKFDNLRTQMTLIKMIICYLIIMTS